MVEDLIDKGCLEKGYTQSAFPAAQLLQVQGKAAMLLMGSRLPAETKKDTPPTFRFDAVPFPQVEDLSVDQTEQDMWASANYILKDAPNVEVAIEYLKLWSSREMQADYYVTEVGDLSPIKGVPVPPDLEAVVKLVSATQKPVPQYLGVNLLQPELFANGYRPVIDRLFLGELRNETFLKAMADARDRLVSRKLASVAPKGWQQVSDELVGIARGGPAHLSWDTGW